MVVLLVNSQPRGGSNEVNWWNSGGRIKASSNVCSKRHEVVTGVMSNVQRLGTSGVWGNGAARSREMVVRHAGLISKTDSRCTRPPQERAFYSMEHQRSSWWERIHRALFGGDMA